MPFDAIQSVLMVWDATQPKTDIEELKTFGHELRKKGKDITFLTFHPIKKLTPDMQPNDLYQLCCKGDFSIWETPKSTGLKHLLNRDFDLLLNGCLHENNWIKTIAAFSKAQFRIGPYLNSQDTNFYEILISPNGADPVENYLIETGRCLRKII